MNDVQANWFLSEIKKNKGSDTEVSKDDLLDFAAGIGLELKKTTAKAKVVDAIVKADKLADLYEAFQEYLLIPEWSVREFLYISKDQFNGLSDLGLIPEQPVLKEYKGSSGRFKANAYPLSILEHDGKALKEAYTKAYHEGSFRVRIETKTEAELDPILEAMAQQFIITQSPDAYEHRDKSGYYHYAKLRLIKDNPLAEQTQAAKITRLMQRISKLEKELAQTKINLYKSQTGNFNNTINEEDYSFITEQGE